AAKLWSGWMHSNCSRSFQKRPTCNKPLKSGCVIAIPGDLALRVYAPGDCVDGSLAINFREGRALPNKPVKVAIASNIGPDDVSMVVDSASKARMCAQNSKAIQRDIAVLVAEECMAASNNIVHPDKLPLSIQPQNASYRSARVLD